MKRRILTNLSSNYVNKLIAFAVAFVLVPLLTRTLGREVYGILVLAESAVLMFDTLTNSLRVALMRYATYACSQQDQDACVAYLSSGRVLLWLWAGIALLVGVIVSVWCPPLMHVRPIYLAQAQRLFLLLTVAFSLSIPNMISTVVVYAKQRPDLVNLSMSGASIVRAVLVVIAYTLRPAPSLWPYGLAYVASMIVQQAALYTARTRLMPTLRIRIASWNPDRVNEVLAFSVHTTVSHLSKLLYDHSPLVIIGMCWGPALVAVYAISLKVAGILKRLFLESCWALVPTFIDLAARRDHRRIEQLLLFYTKSMAIVTTPACLVLFSLRHTFIHAWVGHEFAQAADVLPIHLLSLVTAIPFSICTCLTCAYARIKLPSKVILAAALINIALAWFLGVVCSWTLYGVALAGLISSWLYMTLFLPWYACRIAGLSLRRYVTDGFLKPFGLACAVVGAGLWGMNAWHVSWRLDLATVLMAVGLAAVYGTLAVCVVLSAIEREHVRDILAQLARLRMLHWRPARPSSLRV